MQDGQDTEVTLGTGRLLALFFGLVVICALFFSAGFSLGRKSAPPTLSTLTPAQAELTTGPADKPAPSKSQQASADCTAPGNCPSSPDDMSFYKSVQGNNPNPQLEQPAATASPAGNSPAAGPAASASAQAPEMATPAPLGAGYMVQVAAVTKAEDADALVSALRKKQYPVFSTTLPTDKLYHVQVGPFSDIQQADAMKSKLMSDGYNPIVKK